METTQRQFKAASIDRENAIQENRKLQDDLAAMTCEVQNLQREQETSRAECYDLKRQLQTYVSEVRRAEELLNRKENERTEMLNHFRSLSLEATVLENSNHSLESEAAEAKAALQTARHQIADLERQLTDAECLIKGYETQISNLTQNVASMETQLRQQIEQRHRAETDLLAVRDLCVKLDQQKDTLVEQLGDKNTIKEHYEAQVSRLKAEQSIVQEHMTRDRVTVERLETLLDQARQESMNAQATNQELQNEISRLKQKVSELQNKLSSESAELRQYQNQAAEYSKQISELRRQVTNERFDRARKEEQSRRQTDWLRKPYTAIPKHTCVRDPGQEVGSISRDDRSFSLDCRCSSLRKRIPSVDFIPCPGRSPSRRKFADDTNKNSNLS
ncbi:Centrosomal protein of 135 kDa [Camponotus floridanus]|uniref:Centrosomal protein of 135 kDa n=1 Tax=Camponotus floridanus TaxID=104421 RepID=E2B072_CAMFO|nr:Centrosomal protein of 135 kDa [Camponotus floridanus]